MSRTILLLDMNAYFASVEEVSNPSLKGKPIAVCGEGRTIIVTCSYEARKFGVRTAMSIPEAKKLCPQLILVQANSDKYIDTSLKIHKILLEFSDQVEVFSIDECFVDITYLCVDGVNPKDIAEEIKSRIKKELDLLCSVGIGPNKTVAKLASKMQKPDGLVEIKKQDIPALFKKLKIDELGGIGIGRKTAEKLKLLGIRTASELGSTPIELLKKHFGVNGYFLKNVGIGEDLSMVKKYFDDAPVKSFGHSHTLTRDTADLNVIKAYLMMLSAKTGSRLREKNMKAKTVGFVIRYANFETVMKHRTSEEHIKSCREIYNAGCKIFDKFLPLKRKVRLVGISVSNLCNDSAEEFLFEEMEKEKNLNVAVDALNRKYGDFAVKPSSVIIAQKFKILERCGLIGKYLWEDRKGNNKTI